MAFVVAATWKAKDGEEKRVEETIRKMTPLSRAEEGNLYYQAQVSPTDPGTFFLYEQYVDEAGYLAHGSSEHFTRLAHNYAIPELLEDRQREFFTTFYDDRGGLAG